MVYSREIESSVYTFGVSGRLYKSNVLLYDHQTESLWSQLMNRAVSGPLAGKKLTALPSFRMDWKTWRERHPNTQVLSTETGYRRNYAVDPYEGYYRAAGIWFPVGDVRKDMSPKERVLGVEINGKARTYLVERISEKTGILEDRFDSEGILIEVNAGGEVVRVSDRHNRSIPHVFAYWFAWQAFHPDTTIYTGP